MASATGPLTCMPGEISAQVTAGVRACRGSGCGRAIGLTSSRILPATTPNSHSTERASSRSRTSSGSTHRTATRGTRTSSCRANISGGVKPAISRTPSFWRARLVIDVRQRGRARPHADVGLPVAAERLVRRRRLPVHARMAFLARATTGSLPAMRATARTRRILPRRRSIRIAIRSCSITRHRSSAGFGSSGSKASCGPRSPTTSCSSNTS